MRERIELRRGDVLWIDCDPSVGSEPKKIRTCVVVSNDLANLHGATVTVVPTLSYTAARAERPFLIDLRRPRSTMKDARVANASLVTTYDRARVASRAGRVGPDALRAIDRALAVHLSLAEP
jgi:mRNA interferase MazF